MPGSSVTYAIPFPCEGETINSATFLSFSTAVEAAIASVDALENLTLLRPSAMVANSVTQNVAVGVSTTCVYDTELWDTNNMANVVVNNDRLTIVTNGVYMVDGGVNTIFSPTTVTSNAVLLTKNGTAFAENKADSSNPTYPVHALSIIPCVAGDILRMNYLWTGTGGPGAIGARFVARLICRT